MRLLVAVAAVALAGCAGAPPNEGGLPPDPAGLAGGPPPSDPSRMAPSAQPAPTAPPPVETPPPAEPVPPPPPPPPVAFGSESPDAQGGTWIPPELKELVAQLEPGPGRPTRVTWIGGNAVDGCKEAWRFRLVYGALDRFANLSAFRSRDDARDCEERFKKMVGKNAEAWALSEPLQHRAGPYYVVFTGTLAGEAGLREAVDKALDELRFEKATEVPRNVLPAGAVPGFFQRPTGKGPPPPKSKRGR